MTTRVHRTILVCLFLHVAGGHAGAFAAEYYADNSVAPGGDGSIGAPFGSIQQGLDQLGPGDVLWIRGSAAGRIYSETPVLGVSGTASQPITIKAYPGEKVILTGASGTRLNLTKDYWVIDGITIDQANLPADCIKINASHVTIQGCEIMNGQREGISIERGADITIQDCLIHDFMWIDNGARVDAHGIQIESGISTTVAGVTIQRNTIRRCSGDGAQISGQTGQSPSTYPTDIQFLDNTFICGELTFGLTENALDLKAGDGVLVRGNTMTGYISNKTVVVQKGCRNVSVENNTLSDGLSGIEMRSEGGSGFVQLDNRVVGNLIHGMSSYGLKFDGLQNLTVTNNTLAHIGGPSFRFESSSSTQTDGLRFTNLPIPPGATITQAYLQFETRETQSDPTTLILQGEAADHAATFTTAALDLSSRPLTGAAVSWSPPPWSVVGEAGPDQRTPDLTAVIQEIVNRPGWASGNALAILITGAGHRTAHAYDGSVLGAALLHVEVGGGGSALMVDAGADRTISLPADAMLDGTVLDDGLPDPPGAVTVSWSAGSGPGPVAFQDPNAVDTRATFTTPGFYVLHLSASDGATSTTDSVQITVQAVPPPAEVIILERRIATGSDDAEEQANGNVNLTSSDIEMVFDGSLQTDGLRFTNLTIPPGAAIARAYLQFEADETQGMPTILILQGEAADHASTFTTTPLDLSSRPRTGAAVTWSPPPWSVVGETGAKQRTPDLAAVIQEIVNRPGWASGNALAILITGTGHRTARAYNGQPLEAALLHVEVGGGGPAPQVDAGPDQTISLPADAMLDGTVLDDGLPDPPGAVTVSWSAGSGPGPVTFQDLNAVDTRATFIIPGTYVLRLAASDGAASTMDSVQITVQAAPPPGAVTVERRIATGSDDAEEQVDGSVNLTSSDIEMVFDLGPIAVDGGVIRNNLVYDAAGSPSGTSLLTNVDAGYNGWFLSNAGGLAGAQDVAGPTPGFVDASGEDFRLAPGSMCIDAGTTMGIPSSYHWAGVAPDLGALQSELPPRTITATAGANGTIAPSGVVTVSAGFDQTFTLTPDANHQVADVLVDGVSVGALASYTFTNVTADHTLAASFSLAPRTITATAGANGTIAPSGEVTVSAGADQTFTLAPDANHQVADALVDGVSVGALASYTFTNVTGDHTIAATFTLAPETTVSRRIAAGPDDAEEQADGSVDLTSSNIEMVLGTTVAQTDGLRFTNVTIPLGATITRAYLQFEASETQSEPTALTLQGEAADHATAFTSTPLDLSSRPRTGAAVTWSPAPWSVAGEAGPDQRSPDLAEVIQEIVGRPGWTSGNALAILITGAGQRTAHAYDGKVLGAALLHVEVDSTGPAALAVEIDGPRPDLAIDRVSPIPAFETLSVEFSLADAGPATLELLDVEGRRVASREVGTMGPGRHRVEIRDDLRAGGYLVRLAQGGRVKVRKAIVLK